MNISLFANFYQPSQLTTRGYICAGIGYRF
ncbi:Uncharacterised protein [Capnocytophaga canimorsus]|nr:Uncharacterised protein [Capnocytophaga canimorsus]